MKTKLTIIASVVACLSAACGGGQATVTVKAPATKKAPPAKPAPPVAEPTPPKKVLSNKVGHVTISGDHLIIDKKIHFGNDSDEIQPDSFELLDDLAKALKEHKEIAVLHVIGHTDSNGDDAHNLDLSKRRAAAVVKGLKERGVTQPIDSKGVGETKPACTEDTKECHEKNRRVEFVIEKK